MKIVADKPRMLTDTPLHYCPGCAHGIVHKLVATLIHGPSIPGSDAILFL